MTWLSLIVAVAAFGLGIANYLRTEASEGRERMLSWEQRRQAALCSALEVLTSLQDSARVLEKFNSSDPELVAKAQNVRLDMEGVRKRLQLARQTLQAFGLKAPPPVDAEVTFVTLLGTFEELKEAANRLGKSARDAVVESKETSLKA